VYLAVKVIKILYYSSSVQSSVVLADVYYICVQTWSVFHLG